jgi:AcrR family transcriptional regulator
MPKTIVDRRVERTRKALLDAFVSLVVVRPYDQIKVADIILRANVGRSTFYEHFRDKDAILTHSIQGPFALLAKAVDPGSDVGSVRTVLEHFWSVRHASGGILGGSARRPVGRILAAMIHDRLTARAKTRGGATASPETRRLLALVLAEAQLGAITAWLAGDVTCTAATLAEVIHRTARASASAPSGG